MSVSENLGAIASATIGLEQGRGQVEALLAVRFLRLPMTLFALKTFFMDFILGARRRHRCCGRGASVRRSPARVYSNE